MIHSITDAVRDALDPDFSCETAAHSFDAGIEKANAFIGAITELIDDIPDDPEQTRSFTKTYVLSKLNDSGVSADTCLSSLEGFTTVDEASQAIADGLNSLQNGTITSLNEVQVSVKDAAGNEKPGVALLDLLDEVKENIASGVCARAAIMSSLYTSMADRVAKFSAELSGKIDETFSGYSSIINYYRDLVVSKLDGQGVVKNIFQLSGTSALAQGEPITFKEMDVTQYTGANPLGALSFNTFADGVRTVGVVIGTACAAIWKGITSGINWLWKKASKTVVETFQDPYDVTDSGDTSQPAAFTGFQYQAYMSYTEGTSYDWFIVNLPFGTSSGYTYSQMVRCFHRNAGHWYFMKTLGGEMAIKWEQLIEVNESPESFEIVLDKVSVVMKPYALADDVLQQFRTDFLSYAEYLGSMSDITAAISARVNGPYLDVKADEHELANAFINGYAFHAVTMRKMVRQLAGLESSDTVRWLTNLRYTSSDTITNADWLSIASGYHGSASSRWNQHFDQCPREVSVMDNASSAGADLQHRNFIEEIASDFLGIIAAIVAQKVDLTSNFANYIPYTKDSNEMSVGRFSIKTDAQNQAVAEAFMTAIIAVAIVVAVVVTGVVIAKKISKKLFWKRTEFVSQADNAMWNGKSLSASDRRKYLRYKRKLDSVSSVTKGLSGSSIVEAIQQIDLSGPVSALNGSFAGSDPSVQLPTLSSISAKNDVDFSLIRKILK